MKKLFIFGTTEIGQSRFADHKISPKFLGGNGIIASLSAAKHIPVSYISVIGTDIDIDKLSFVLGDAIELTHLTVLDGETFQYIATYDQNTEELIDQKTNFGVYGEFDPNSSLDIHGESIKAILFSGSKPQLSSAVLDQLSSTSIIGVDVIMYHLIHNFDAQIQLISKTDILFCNSREYECITQQTSQDLFSYFPNIKVIFCKRGKKGVSMITAQNTRTFDARPGIVPINPTGAGDAFAGTVMSYIAKNNSLDIPKDVIINAQDESVKVIMNDRYYRKLFEEVKK
jgi:sugar/nucleoside kinase (ribokinase family)